MCWWAGPASLFGYCVRMHIFRSTKKQEKHDEIQKTKAIQSHYWKTIEKALQNPKKPKKPKHISNGRAAKCEKRTL
jgi:hypothetical protein